MTLLEKLELRRLELKKYLEDRFIKDSFLIHFYEGRIAELERIIKMIKEG